MSAEPASPKEGRKRRTASDEAEAGFSLVEVMISMVVMGGLACSVFYFLSSQNGMGARGNDTGNDHDTASPLPNAGGRQRSRAAN